MNATRLGLYAAAVGLALAVLPAARLSAQDGQLAYHDSLPSFSRADLRATLRRAVAAPASTGELLRAGFAAFRLYELDREKVLADSAKKLFEGALAREPGSAWAHYGLGLVLSRGPGIRVSSPGRVLDGVVTAQVFAELFGVDPRARALRELRTALQIDPVLVPALLEMADHALQERAEETLHEARNALFQATQRISSRRVWLALSGVESALGIADGAQNAAERLLRADSTDALALHAYARALLAQKGKMEAGVHSYLRGLSHADSSALDLYFDDLRPILSGREVDTWRWLPAADRSLWIRRFWELRAGRAGLTVNERIGEHFARVLEAEQRYRRAAQYGAPPEVNAVRKEERAAVRLTQTWCGRPGVQSGPEAANVDERVGAAELNAVIAVCLAVQRRVEDPTLLLAVRDTAVAVAKSSKPDRIPYGFTRRVDPYPSIAWRPARSGLTHLQLRFHSDARAPVPTRAITRNSARAFASVSSYSLLGTESATMPAPA